LDRIVSIVEGHGDRLAINGLLRRIAARKSPDLTLDLPKPIRVPKSRLLKSGELERAVELAARQSGEAGTILILLDADDDCPAQKGPELLARAVRARPDRKVRVVLAKREFEAWFLAAARSISGKRGLVPDLVPPAAPEEIADAKGWLSHNSVAGRTYHQTIDQPALVEIFDLDEARAADSFDKLWRDVINLL